MGIRIHKAIGYSAKHPDSNSLYDTVWEKEKDGEVATLLNGILDPYIDSPQCIMYKENPEQYPYPKFFHEIVHNCSSDDVDPYAGPFIIVPPSHMKSWYRWDDPIDYVEETLTGEPSADRLQVLSNPLYPFSGWLRPDGSEPALDREEGIIPMIPTSIRLIATHLGFNWLELRPAIATWWR